ncbi:hypothetical protein F4558_002773 [Micromonospora profundi]|uniref:hypothetical protein n=1 Tax=Micromonospora profundi TaxID=1420889 RepID=UPI00143947D9|nr:hypothetical protein [Micromonospora profundi]NJC12947.1 hypothetical protein [Micromonospora profundi]
MSTEHSVWQTLRNRKGNMLDLPPLEQLVPPKDKIMRGLLANRVCWVAGPPKVGKTVVAHYAAYLKWMAFASHDTYPPQIMTIDGGPECARAVDLAIEAPHKENLHVVVFENPFGATGTRPNAVFLRQLRLLIEARPDLYILVTTRPRGYIEFNREIEPLSQYTTPLALSDWYASHDLARYAARGEREGVVPPAQLQRLSTPALIDEYLLHNVSPNTPAQRDVLRRRFGGNVEDVTLDKLAVLKTRRDIGKLAVLLRLQEHAPTLLTTDEISAVAGFEVTDHPHLSLVAVPYEFDGLRRLRFEHSTAREAADLLLSESAESSFSEFRGLDGGAGLGAWIGRALELWTAQQEIARGDWTGFGARREDIRITLASDALALADRSIAPAVKMILELSYDEWTAQDLGYEIASAWPDYAHSEEVRSLALRLMRSAQVDGGYALLEALLYVRSKDVKELWEWLDGYLLGLATMDREPTKQLLLALDGLAWRPPPDWHELGFWAKTTLERLDPHEDAWGFIRFMAGYHPEGVAYLARKASESVQTLVAQDQGVEWNAGQADTASWLVRWHYVHQCRARAQLARQPWLDQQFLCQSFHPEVTHYDRDHNAARLIRSLRTSGRDAAGWGFFLAENLRAVAPSTYGEKTQTEGRLSLREAEPGGQGVLAVVLTYSVDQNVLADVQSHFHRPAAVTRLMEALTDGLVVSGTRLLEPRFSYRRNLAAIYSTCGLDWSDVKAAIPPSDLLTADGVFDVEGLIRRLEEAARAHPLKEDQALNSLLVEVIRRVRSGDLTALTPMEHRAPRNAGRDQAYLALLESSVAFLATKEHAGG